MKPTVTYFPMQGGRGFAIRAALRYAKVDFSDNRITGRVFGTEYKPDPSKAPLGSLPVLTLPEGQFTQCTALARWAARKSDLYPKDELSQLIVDEVMETMNELVGKAGFGFKDDAEKKATREEFAKTALPQYLSHVTERIKLGGGGPFLLGKKISVADLFIYGQLGMIYSGNLDHVPKDIIEQNFPLVHTLYTSVEKSEIARAELDAKV